MAFSKVSWLSVVVVSSSAARHVEGVKKVVIMPEIIAIAWTNRVIFFVEFCVTVRSISCLLMPAESSYEWNLVLTNVFYKSIIAINYGSG